VSGPTNSPFGANDWLVDELYQQYLEDKQSVDPAWWDFFADYSPADHSPHASATKPAAPVAPAAAPAVAQPAVTIQFKHLLQLPKVLCLQTSQHQPHLQMM
jgi:multifunctional 2-oxoglutarate metabolism enzyme